MTIKEIQTLPKGAILNFRQTAQGPEMKVRLVNAERDSFGRVRVTYEHATDNRSAWRVHPAQLHRPATLTFTDGMAFDLSGPLRVETRADGVYVVGFGLLLPVADAAEGKRYIATRVEAERDRAYVDINETVVRLGMCEAEALSEIERAAGREIQQPPGFDIRDALAVLDHQQLWAVRDHFAAIRRVKP